MLQVTRLAPQLLHEASDNIVEFLNSQIHEDGGGVDRAGQSDLYYTVFTLEGLLALQAPLPVERTLGFLRSYEDPASLDLIHLACLARCWASMPKGSVDPGRREAILREVERYRSLDGGYSVAPELAEGSAYHCFMAVGAYQDLGVPLPKEEALLDCVGALALEDGSFANSKDLPLGNTPTTAAAVTLLRQSGRLVPAGAGDWLLAQCSPEGGFLAIPEAPMPDLLSTATALHALAGLQRSFEPVKERCLDFLDTLWTGKAFCGSWGDDQADSEYTFYALLALGHLSL
jgi:hypothetical protein